MIINKALSAPEILRTGVIEADKFDFVNVMVMIFARDI